MKDRTYTLTNGFFNVTFRDMGYGTIDVSGALPYPHNEELRQLDNRDTEVVRSFYRKLIALGYYKK